MTRRTARISVLVEFDDEDLEYVNPQTVNVQTSGSGWPSARLDITGCTIIGTPRVEPHKTPISSVSHDEFMETLQRMEWLGGSFVTHLGETLAHADSVNRQRLLDEFWNEFCKYRKVEA